jgi:signal transduction histidine kinase
MRARTTGEERRGFAVLWPTAALALALPIVAYAILRSSAWVGTTFPGFFLMNNAVVPTVSGFAWPSDRNAIFHAEVIRVDGQPVDRSGAVYAYVASKPVGTPIEYVLRAGGDRELRETIASRRFGGWDFAQTYGVMLLFGSAWLVFGIAVGFLQPHKTQAKVFLFQSLVAGLYPICGVFLYQGDLEWLSHLYFLLECLFPATWIHLAVVFPVEHEMRGRLLATPLLAYGISLVCTVLVLRGLAAEPVDLAPLHATYLYAGASFLLFLVNLAVQFRHHRDAAVRSRIKAVLPGAMLAGTLAFFALTNSALASRDFPVQFGLVLTPLFSACVAYAIAKHELFDIDRIVRQSFVYALLTVTIIAGYALIVAAAPRLMPGTGFRALRLAFFLALAFAFDPLRRLIQSAVDRAFYRTRLSYEKTITGLSEAMTSLLDMREIVGQLTKVVSDEMYLESASVCLFDASASAPRVWRHGRNGLLKEILASEGAAALELTFQRDFQPSWSGALLERLANPTDKRHLHELLSALDADLIVPIHFRDEILAAMILGRRLSGRSFDSDDVNLLRTLANQTAIAIHNAQSYEALEDLNRTLDAQVSEQTKALRTSNDELRDAYGQLKDAQAQLLQSEKLASLGRLVAGVAHELNNPASFVHGGLANLSRYLERLMKMVEAFEKARPTDREATAELNRVREETGLDYVLRETPTLLRICSEGSERIKKIVDDLRVFARADRGDRLPTDVVDGIQSTLRLLGNRIERQGVEVITAFEELPAIDGNAGLLNQVWMNLLGNALDALEGTVDPALRITARSDGESKSIEVVVSDNGPGIAPEHLSHLFEPFFTTKPVGSGTGLGLSIVYGAIKSHGGSIEVESKPDNGTSFAVRLPRSSPLKRT